MWSVPTLVITAEERAELERRVRGHTTPQRMVRRCRLVLMAADGVASRRIGPAVGMSEQYVGMWRRRFEAERLQISRIIEFRDCHQAIVMQHQASGQGKERKGCIGLVA